MRKAPMPFSCFLFRRTGILLKFAQNRLEIPLCDKDATLPRRSLHIGSQVQTRGVSALCEVDRGMIQQAGGNGCARLQRASASSGVAAPQGCGTFSLITAWSFLHRYQSGQQLKFSIKTIRHPNVHCKTECILLQYSEKSLEWRRYTICPLSLFAMTSRK